MADFDDVKRRSIMQQTGEDLLRTRTNNRNTPSIEGRRLEQRAHNVGQELARLENMLKAGSVQGDAAVQVQKQMVAQIQMQEDLKRRQQEYNERHLLGVNNQFTQSVQTAIGPAATASAISEARRSNLNIGAARQYQQQFSPFELQKLQNINQNQLSMIDEQITAHSIGVADNTPGSPAAFKEAMATRQNLLYKMGVAQQAESINKAMGLDPKSQFLGMNAAGDKFRSEQRINQINADAAGGRLGSASDISGNIDTLQGKFLDTLEKFNDAIENNTDAAGEFAEQLNNLNSQIEDQQAQLKAVQANGGGGGIIGNFLRSNAAGAAGASLSALGRFGHAAGVTTELEQLGVQTGYAQISNRRFDDYMGLGAGDARSIRRVLQNAQGTETAYGLKLANRADNAGNMMMTGGALEGGNAIATSALGGPSSAIIAAAGQLDQRGAMALRYGKGITQGGAAIAGTNSMMSFQDEINKIPDAVLQSAIDVTKGSTLATRGLGGGRESMMGLLTDPGMRRIFARNGMTNEDIAQATSMGVQGLGSEFDSSDITRAGQLRQGGMISSVGQYMQARESLSGIGGGADRFEQIMRTAVAAGMDNSKNVSQMVSATVQLSQRSATSGIQESGALADMLGRGVGALDHLNPNMRAGVAANAVRAVNRISEDGSLNFANVLHQQRLRKIMPDAEPLALAALGKTSLSELMQVKRGFNSSAEAGQTAAADLGFKGMITADNIDQLLAAQREQIGNDVVGFDITKYGPALREARSSGNKFSKLSTNLQNTVIQLGKTHQKLGKDVNMPSFWNSSFSLDAAGQAMPKAAGPKSLEGERLTTVAAAGRDANLFGEGMSQFQTVMDNLGTVLQSLSTNTNIGGMGGATKKSAEEYELATDSLGTNTKRVANSLDTLADTIEDVVDRLKKVSDKTKGMTASATISDMLKRDR